MHNPKKYRAIVIKNGVLTQLTDSIQYSRAFSVFVLGNFAYAVGVSKKDNRVAATVWKNGVATALSDGTGLGRTF